MNSGGQGRGTNEAQTPGYKHGEAREGQAFPRGRSCASAGCSTRTMSRTTRRVGAGIGRRTRSGSTPTRGCSKLQNMCGPAPMTLKE